MRQVGMPSTRAARMKSISRNDSTGPRVTRTKIGT
jgi:hypothetical protein